MTLEPGLADDAPARGMLPKQGLWIDHSKAMQHRLQHAFSPDGHTLALASVGANSDNTLRLWDIRTGAERTRLPFPTSGRSNEIRTVDFSENGRQLTAGSVRWDLDSNSLLPQSAVTCESTLKDTR